MDDYWPAGSFYGDEALPVAKQVYTVREVVLMGGGVPCIRLVEVNNVPLVYQQGVLECAFETRRFRPLITRTQADDVALFVHNLDRVPSGLETVDIAFLRAWADEGIIPFADYAAELTARGLA